MRPRTVHRRLGRLTALAAALCLGGGLLTGPAQAVTAAPATGQVASSGSGPVSGPGSGPSPSDGQAHTAPYGQSPTASYGQPAGPSYGRPRTPADRPPLADPADVRDREHTPRSAPVDHPRPSMAGRSPARPAAACDVADFTRNTGGALVAKIKAATTDCVNTLFALSGADARGAFREAQMTTAAYALRDGSAAYPGNGTTGLPQLVLFLRAGYYVQWYHSGDTGPYGAALRTAIRSGLDAFFAAPRSRDVTDANGETLAEAVTLIDSAQENARYLYVVERLLKGYDSSYDASWWMLSAVNNVYTVLFRGHQVPAFVTAVERSPAVLYTLYEFAATHLDLLGGKRSYLTANAGRELGRFLQHASLRERARPYAVDLLRRSAITGRTAPLWVGVAEMADYYDRAACAQYGVCDLQKRLTDAVLTVRHTCGPSITVRAQQMTAAELASTCASLSGQDAFFHGVARDSGPVADDRNTTIEVTVFDSAADYQTYAGAIYGIDTNNGGMYLEGDPAAAGNQPRFIAYEADWLRPDFAIWNLNHEYTHYLDGRFDMYGDFDAGVSTPTVWWIEGFAEYVSYSYRKEPYREAAAEAAKHTYKLSTVFDTAYGDDTTRVYRWGYLAVRYLLENHRADVDAVLAAYRTGDWQGARRHLTETIGTRYDADWDRWLTACAAGGCGTGAGAGAGR
ncbi:collagenase [Streptomyces varsoviensis]|uniref:collagenase n=1 Tax=Streptomyces varsoviensis TaxID=67373 RepID=UPI00099626F3|nr:collagenase [Streptomyces varsoviensis]